MCFSSRDTRWPGLILRRKSSPVHQSEWQSRKQLNSLTIPHLTSKLRSFWSTEEQRDFHVEHLGTISAENQNKNGNNLLTEGEKPVKSHWAPAWIKHPIWRCTCASLCNLVMLIFMIQSSVSAVRYTEPWRQRWTQSLRIQTQSLQQVQRRRPQERCWAAEPKRWVGSHLSGDDLHLSRPQRLLPRYYWSVFFWSLRPLWRLHKALIVFTVSLWAGVNIERRLRWGFSPQQD